MMKISKTRYLQGFCIVVVLLAMVRCAFPKVAADTSALTHVQDSVLLRDTVAEETEVLPVESPVLNVGTGTRFFDDNGKEVKNRILSVASFAKSFPDSNSVQLIAARQWGIEPVADREEAEHRKGELVYVGSNMYYEVDKLHSSIPYLVPRAALLLQDIGSSFYDSLQTKGVPLHSIIVTSVTRSKADVERLRRHNSNATEQSCHMYGTTFDICYNRYHTVQTESQPRREVRNDSLKWILSEVLRDQRESGKCFVKYERKQGCFHITVR